MNTSLMFSSKEQTWETPIDLFNRLNNEFNFTLDVCALPETAKCNDYYTPSDDGLKQRWLGICWMNPPYNDVKSWMKKAYKESKKGATVVCLVPSRTDTEWWHKYAMLADEIRYVKGRLKFGKSKNSAPFPSVIIIFRPRKKKRVKTRTYLNGNIIERYVHFDKIDDVRKIRVTHL